MLHVRKKILLNCAILFNIEEKNIEGFQTNEDQARELTRCIRENVNKLSDQWKGLLHKSNLWQQKLDENFMVIVFLLICKYVSLIFYFKNFQNSLSVLGNVSFIIIKSVSSLLKSMALYTNIFCKKMLLNDKP